jgi:hypothetical protein
MAIKKVGSTPQIAGSRSTGRTLKIRKVSTRRNCARPMTGHVLLLALPALLFQTVATGQVKPAFTDLAAHVAEQPAINNMVTQGIIRAVSPTQFSPDAPNTRGAFAVSVQHMFNLPKPAQAVTFSDVPSSSSIFTAVQAIAPFQGRQILCSGCALGSTFGPNEPVTRAETAVLLTGILIAQKKVALTSPAEAESALAKVPDANELRGPARLYLATALQSGVITLTSASKLDPASQRTRADTAVLLDSVQKKFAIPQVRP